MITPFRPSGLLKNPHIQTVRGNLRSTKGIRYRRHRLETPDDDFIDLDIPTVAGHEAAAQDSQAPIVLALHGLGGSARRGYMCEFYRGLAAVGIRTIGMNYRGASDEINRQPRTYHSGAIDDIDFVYRWIRQTYPNTPCGIAAISIGGIMMLNLLGQRELDLSAAVAISPALNLNLSARQISNSRYNNYLLRKLKAITQQKAHQVGRLIDVERTLQAETIYQFDEFCTAPLNGFLDAEDYYTRCSPDQYLHAITIPTMIIRAVDDPFLDPADIPHQALAQNRHITSHITERGGHVGFADGSLLRPRWWGHEQAIHFLQTKLN